MTDRVALGAMASFVIVEPLVLLCCCAPPYSDDDTVLTGG